MSLVLKKLVENAVIATFVQIIIRVMTVFSSAYSARLMPGVENQVGIVNVRLLLLETLILLLSKEPIRKVCLKRVHFYNWQELMNMIWIILPISIVVGSILSWVWINVLDPPPSDLIESYNFSVWGVAISCVIDMIGEAPNLATKAFFFNYFRNFWNVMYVLCRTTVFLIMLACTSANYIEAFLVAQLASTTFWVIGLYIFFYLYLKSDRQPDETDIPVNSITQFFPSTLVVVPNELILQSWGMTGAVVWDHFLIEGEQYVMTFTKVLTFNEQGIYFMVTSLGSLPAQLLLKPLSHNYFFYYSHIFGSQPVASVRDLSESQRKEATKVTAFSLRTFIFLGLMITLFGWFNGNIILGIYGGQSSAVQSAVSLLVAQGFVFCLMAIRVVTDNFILASMNSNQVKWYNRMLMIIMLIHWFAAWDLTCVVGGLGLIIASCISMSLRIMIGVYHINKVYEGEIQHKPITALLPSKECCIILLSFLIVSTTSKMLISEYHEYTHLGVCIFGFVASCIMFKVYEKDIWNFVRSATIQPNQQMEHQD